MQIDNLQSELGFALARGDVGLWIGPDGLVVGTGEEKQILTKQSWLGVWSESHQTDFALALESSWREKSAARMVVEVPDLVEDALGEHFKFSDFCPYFYLNGKVKGADSLSPLRREDSKREKAKYLERLGASVLLVSGYREPSALASLLEREVGEYGARLRLIILVGYSVQEIEQSKSGLAARRPDLAARINGTDLTLPALLSKIDENRKALPAEPTILVGSASIPLRSLLRTEPPIDQDFIIVTEQDVRSPDAKEDKQHMLTELLAGRQPAWRAFAHSLAWKRNPSHLKSVFDGLERMRKEDLTVYCINIPAEPGAGLTVLLQQIAFETARQGHPCLLHRQFGSELNYDLLRRFLTDLQHEVGSTKGAPPPPAVIIFDAPSVEGDSKSLLQDLPLRLARDGRRALVIRGVPVRSASETEDASFKRNYAVRARGNVAQDWLQTISAGLTSGEQDILANWAAKHFRQAGQPMSEASLETIRNWNLKEQEVPLLICLYFILADEYRATAGLGKHLTDRLKKILPRDMRPRTEKPDAGSRLATYDELQEAFGKPGVLGPRFGNRAEADRDDVASIFVALAALGCLRIGAPRDVLDAISGISWERVLSAVAILEKHDLALTDLPVDGDVHQVGGYQKRSDDRLAPLAFYTAKETVGLRHPAYGRLVLDWLGSGDGAEDRRLLSMTYLNLQSALQVSLQCVTARALMASRTRLLTI